MVSEGWAIEKMVIKMVSEGWAKGWAIRKTVSEMVSEISMSDFPESPKKGDRQIAHHGDEISRPRSLSDFYTASFW